jgi:dihydropteroate synthase
MTRAPLAERWSRPAVVGVLNVTPDSFSDGGAHFEPAVAVAAARAMIDAGACAVDVGGESTRPGAAAVSLEEELRRVLPVIDALAGLPLSIDTSKAEVARQALALGVELVNDITALRGDPELAGVVADADASLCLMHMQGDPLTMQDAPHYEDVVDEVVAFLAERLEAAVASGIREDQICLDPGIGFGKTPAQNVTLLRNLDRLVALGRPVFLGLSRKSTLARIVSGNGRVATDAASVGAAVAAFDAGASIFRAHDVLSHVEALAVAAALLAGPTPSGPVRA